MQRLVPSRLLRIALLVDAAATGVLAALQLAVPDALARLLMLPRSLLLETGVFLVGYALLLAVMARSPRLWSLLAGLIVLGNIAWAAGCAVLLGTGAIQPSALGIVYVAMQALAVVAFACAQYLGMQQSAPVGGRAERGWQPGA